MASHRAPCFNHLFTPLTQGRTSTNFDKYKGAPATQWDGPDLAITKLPIGKGIYPSLNLAGIDSRDNE